MYDLIIDILRAAINLPLNAFSGRNKVRILLYHKVCDLPPGKYQFHAVPPMAFVRQMEYLQRKKYNVITLAQFAACKDRNLRPPRKTVIITFDDGYMDNYRNAFPILQKCGFKATFFVVTSYIDSAKPFPWLDWDAPLLAQFAAKQEDWLPLTAGMVLEMSAAGHEIASHTITHPFLSRAEAKEAFAEIKGSRERLEKMLGKPVHSFSYPYGDFNEKAKDIVKAAGYKAAVATNGAGSTLDSDFYALGRVVLERGDSFLRFKNKLQGAYDWERYRYALLDFFHARRKK